MVIAHLQEEAAEADAAAAKAAASASSSSTPAPSSSSYALHYHRLVDMGYLLLSFFRRFGKSFDYERQAVRVSKGGVRPKPASWVLPDRPRYLLSVEDPQEQGKDIGSGTFNVMAVRECFSRAADALSAVLERQERHAAAAAKANAREGAVFARGGAVSGTSSAHNSAAAFRNDPVATEAAWRDVQAEGSSRSLPPVPAAARGSLPTSGGVVSLLRSVVDVDSIAIGRRVARAGGGGVGAGGGGGERGGGGGGGGGNGSSSLPLPFKKGGKSPHGGASSVSPSKHHPEMHRHVAHLVPASKAPEGRRMGKFAAKKARENGGGGRGGGGGGGGKGPPPPLSTSALVFQHQQQTQGWNHISVDGGRGGGGGGGSNGGRGGGSGGGGGGRGGRGGGGRGGRGWNNRGGGGGGGPSSSAGGVKKARWRSRK